MSCLVLKTAKTCQYPQADLIARTIKDKYTKCLIIKTKFTHDVKEYLQINSTL